MLLVLEGGYNLHSISRSCEAAVRVLLGEDPVPFPHDFGAYSLSCASLVDLNVWLAGSLSFCYDSFLFLGGVGLATKEVGVLTSVFSLYARLHAIPPTVVPGGYFYVDRYAPPRLLPLLHL